MGRNVTFKQLGLVLLVVVFWAASASAVQYGPKIVGSCSSETGIGTEVWTNPGNATASDDADAVTSLGGYEVSNWLKCTMSGNEFEVDPDDTIEGIIVSFEREASGSNVQDNAIHIVQDAYICYGSACPGSNVNRGNLLVDWTSKVEEVIPYGGDTDLWGEQWVPAQINSSDFGVALSILNDGNPSRIGRIDAISITIKTSPPQGRIYSTGFDTFRQEDRTDTGSPEYIAAAKRADPAGGGNAGLQVSTTGAAEQTCYVNDQYLALRVCSRAYFKFPTDGVAISSSANIMEIHQDSEIGCYLEWARDAVGNHSLNVKYHGKETVDLDFTSVNIDAEVGDGLFHAGEVCQVLTPGTEYAIACQFYFDGFTKADFSLEMGGDCTNEACDLNKVCLGPSAASTVTFQADDWVIADRDEPANIGLGYVTMLHPNADGDTGWQEWSSQDGGPGHCPTDDSDGWQCVDDWATGADETTVCNGGQDGRRRRHGTGNNLQDIWHLTNFDESALGYDSATDEIKSVHVINSCCNSSGTSVVKLYQRYGGQDATDDGHTLNDDDWDTWGFFRNADPAENDWDDTKLDSLQVGYGKDLQDGTTHCTALLVYVEVKEPSPLPPQNLQDWTGDGYLTLASGCDSITRGTASSICEGGNCSNESCTDDDDCTVSGAVCADGLCQLACASNDDCNACDVTAVCPGAYQYMRRVAARSEQWENIYNCGEAGRTSRWWVERVKEIMMNPAETTGNVCTLIKGNWGHCLTATDTPCMADVLGADDNECPSEPCVPHIPDYLQSICGVNNYLYVSAMDCRADGSIASPSAAHKVPAPRDGYGQPLCPEAVPTPGAYQCDQISCTGDGDGTCAATWTNSDCMGTCTENTTWPCIRDQQCSYCQGDTDRPCWNIGKCADDEHHTCREDADCPAEGTCDTTNMVGHDDADCETCEQDECRNSAPNLYCTCPCGSISCTTDADCEHPSGGYGGICVSGSCTNCGAGAWGQLRERCVSGTCADTGGACTDDLDCPNTAKLQILTDERGGVTLTGGRSSWGAWADRNTVRELVEDQTPIETHPDPTPSPTPRPMSKYIDISYMNTCMLFHGMSVCQKGSHEHTELMRQAENYVDLFHLGRVRDDRIAGEGPAGTLLFIDGIHNWATTGADLMAEGVEGLHETLYPVCSLDTSVACAGCEVSCSLDSECVPGPTHTPSPGICAFDGATPSPKKCQCFADSDCASGRSCEIVAPTATPGATPAATPKRRCIGTNFGECPAGDNVLARKLLASDEVCATRTPDAGLCTAERSRPRCTKYPLTPCADDNDCTGEDAGDICAMDAVWKACQHDSECRDSGVYPSDICAPKPFGDTTPTTKPKFCRQATRTPG